MSKLIYPDYSNCIANLPNSILKKFGAKTVGEPLPMAEPYLQKDYANVVVILLDGMGKTILERHLQEDGLFRSNLAGIYSSTFLSTTVAATTSMMSGLQPCEHSWLGWDCYYPQIDKNVTVFLNTVQCTSEQAAAYNVAGTFTPFVNVVDRINRSGGQARIVAPFLDKTIQDFAGVCDGIRRYCEEPGGKYIYAYWNQPDGVIHRNGCGANIVRKVLRKIEARVAKLAEDFPDTLFLVTADHGHIDTELVWIKDYPVLTDCLERMPSLEPRVLNLFVKEGKEETFVTEFNRLFGDRFLLMPMDEAIARNLFGTGAHHECFRGMLGNYLAIATGNLSIMVHDEFWVSLHGSLTEDEMLIPLIVLNGK